MTASSAILKSLRQATQQIHAELEEGELSQRLLSSDLKRPEYERILTVFGAWFVAAERVLTEHREWIEDELDDARFQNENRLIEDLQGKKLPVPRLPAIPRDEVPGWLYVIEGSTLGGRRISGHLMGLTAPEEEPWPMRFFRAYGPETGERWQAFVRYLNDKLPPHHPEFEAAVKGAVNAFESFKAWQDSQVSHPSDVHETVAGSKK